MDRKVVPPVSKTLILAPNKGPPFDESWANRVSVMSDVLHSDVFTTGETGSFMEKKGSYTIFRRGLLGNIALLLYTAFKHRNYDTVIIEERPDYRMGVAILFMMLTRILNPGKCVCEFETEWMDEFRMRGWAMRFYIGRILPHARLIKVMSAASEEFLRQRLGLENVVLVHGVDLEKFAYAPAKEGPFRLLFASAPRATDTLENKGVPLLLLAVKMLVSKGLDVKLVLLWRGAHLDRVNEMIWDTDLGDVVEIVNRNVDMPRYFKGSHAAVLVPVGLTSTPHYPASVMESLASGKPVIVSKGLEISAIIGKSGCGKVCEPDAEDLAKKIATCIRDYGSLQKNCLSVARQYFDIRKNLSSLKGRLS